MTEIPFAVLRQWLDHKLIPFLDAEDRLEGQHRRFSDRDVALLCELYAQSRRLTIPILARKIDSELI